MRSSSGKVSRRTVLSVSLGATGAELFLAAIARAGQAPAVAGHATTLLKQDLGSIENPEVSVALVEYPPGTESQPHRHSGPVFGYVLEGKYVFQVEGGEAVNYKQGDVFFEPLGHAHMVSRNPSKTETTRLLAVLIGQQGQPATVPYEPKSR